MKLCLCKKALTEFEGIDGIDYKHFFELVTDSTQSNHQLRGHPRKICKARYNKRIMKNSFSHRVRVCYVNFLREPHIAHLNFFA